MERLSTGDPRRIGDYRLLKKLGEGGMGRVYLARSPRGRTAAVKVVQPRLAQQPDFRKRFALEIAAARRVGGEWTAPVLDADTEAETPWVATGYVAGPSLAEVVDEQYGPLPEHSVSALASGLVAALQAVHGAGLIHRDLKPSNVLVTIDGPRVIDFGIARALDSAVASTDGLTHTGAMLGSPGFMSPEQVRGEKVTAAGDVFCLGAVLAYAATGRLPFGSNDSGVHAVLYRIVEEDPDLSSLSGELLGLVSACLRKEPAERPTLTELAAATHGELDHDWLPPAVLARLGRHAVQLLDAEDPETQGDMPGLAAAAEALPVEALSVDPPPVETPAPQPPPYVPSGEYGPPEATSFTQAAVPGSVPGPEASRPWGRVLHVLLGLFLLWTTVSLVFDASSKDAVESVAAYRPHELVSDVEGLAYTKGTGKGLLVVGALVSASLTVVWLSWFRQARLIAEQFAPGEIRYRPALAVLGWFVPVWNFFGPKKILNDLWRTANRDTAPPPRLPLPRNTLLNWWWGVFLLYNVMFFRASALPWTMLDAEAAAATLGSQIFIDVLGIPLAVLTFAVVQRLDGLQQLRRAESGTSARGTGTGRQPDRDLLRRQ